VTDSVYARAAWEALYGIEFPSDYHRQKAIGQTTRGIEWAIEDELLKACQVAVTKEGVKKTLTKQDLAARHATLRDILKRWKRHKPEVPYELVKTCAKLYGYPFEKEDAEAPFWSEAFLYNIFGKEEARALLGFFSQIENALGMAE